MNSAVIEAPPPSPLLEFWQGFSANRGALIDGRSEFTQAVRRSLAEAHRQRQREHAEQQAPIKG